MCHRFKKVKKKYEHDEERNRKYKALKNELL